MSEAKVKKTKDRAQKTPRRERRGVGGQSENFVMFLVNTNVPQPGANARAALFPNGGPFTATGSADAGTTITVRLYLPDTNPMEGTAQIGSDQQWTVAFGGVTSLAPNTLHRLLVRGTNGAGEQTAQGIAFFQQPEPEPLAPSITSLNADPGGDHNLILTGNITSGTSTPLSPGQLTASGASSSGSMPNSDGTFTFTTPSDSSATTQTVTFTAINSDGATSVFEFSFDLELTAPTITNVDADTPMPTNHDFTITGTATDEPLGSGVRGVTATITAPNGTSTQDLVPAGTTFSLPLTAAGLGDGTTTVTFEAFDGFGNKSAVETFTAFVDTVAPLISALTADVPSPVNRNFNIAGTLDDPNPSGGLQDLQVVITRQGGASVGPVSITPSPQFTFPVDLAALPDAGVDGDYDVQFKAADLAGNVSPEATFTFTVDRSNPTITAPTANVSMPTNQDFTLTGTANDANGVQRVKVTIVSGSTTTPQADADFSSPPTYTFAVDVTSSSPTVGQGIHTVQFQAVDMAGNESDVASIEVTVDTTQSSPTLYLNSVAPPVDYLIVDFGEDMNSEADDFRNYTVSGLTGVTVTGVQIVGPGTRRIFAVILSRVLNPGETGTLTIASPPVADRAGNLVAGGLQNIAFSVAANFFSRRQCS